MPRPSLLQVFIVESMAQSLVPENKTSVIVLSFMNLNCQTDVSRPFEFFID